MNQFIVLTALGTVSTDSQGNPEQFDSLPEAMARARELAAMSHGTTIKVFKILREVVIAPPQEGI